MKMKGISAGTMIRGFVAIRRPRNLLTQFSHLEARRDFASVQEEFSIRPLPLDASHAAFAKLLPDLPLSEDSKRAFLAFADTKERDEALLAVAKDINSFLAQTMSKRTSEAAYSKRNLQVYDAMVWQFNSPFLWRIEQQDIEDLYDECVGERHCEVAVGTGLFLTNPRSSKIKQITLVDLNPNTLQVAKERLTPIYSKDVVIDTHIADILQSDLESSVDCDSLLFDSIAANFLIHCLHGGEDVARKAFSNISSALSPSGTFFGSTILGHDMVKDGEGVAGKAGLETLVRYNDLGIFGNLDDSMESITNALSDAFEQVEVWRIGYCALWKATRPRHHRKLSL